MKLLSATVMVETDPNTGELVLPIPDEWFSELHWQIGDKMEWIQRINGDWQLSNLSLGQRKRRASRAKQKNAGKNQTRNQYDNAD